MMRSVLPLTFLLCLAVTSAVEARGTARKTLADWWRVRTLAPDTRISVRPKNGKSSVRYFVSADDVELVVVRVVDRGRRQTPDRIVERIQRADIDEVRAPVLHVQPDTSALRRGLVAGGLAGLALHGQGEGAEKATAIGLVVGGFAALTTPQSWTSVERIYGMP